MKIQNLSKTAVLLLCSVTTFAQPFQTSVYTPDEDYNHFSIEQTSRGYVTVGTRFSHGNNDIKIICFDHDGNPIWERFIDETKDDRGLDVAVDDNDDIVLTGYISPKGNNKSDVYLAKFDINGNLITDRLLELDNGTATKPSTAGTNIIFSKARQTFIVGGYLAKENTTPLIQNASFVAEFNSNLDLIQERTLFRNYSHQSINDIVEVDGGFFVTGGLSYTRDQQSVMAVKLDYSLEISTDLSFRDYRAENHCGASLSYFKKGDAIAILSNNSNYGLPQITVFTDISSPSPYLFCNYLLRLDIDGKGEKAAGYKLEQSLHNKELLVASGYFKNAINADGSDRHTLAWIVEFDVERGEQMGGLVWHTPNAEDFAYHGGDLLSTAGSMPYVYNQEMMTQRLDKEGYVLIAPRSIDGNFGIDLLTTYYLEPSDCFRPLEFKTHELKLIPVGTDKSVLKWKVHKDLLKAQPSKSKYDQFCLSVHRSAIKKKEEAQLHTIIDFSEMNVYPNPSNGEFVIEFQSTTQLGYIQLFNSQGEVVLEKHIGTTQETIDASGLPKGIYLLKNTLLNGDSEQCKIVLY